MKMLQCDPPLLDAVRYVLGEFLSEYTAPMNPDIQVLLESRTVATSERAGSLCILSKWSSPSSGISGGSPCNEQNDYAFNSLPSLTTSTPLR